MKIKKHISLSLATVLLFASVTPSITALAEVTSYNSVQDSSDTSADLSIISEENSNVTMSADEKKL
ncbi:hypothetical protein STPL106120_04235 [Streptococcus pluranimalium]|uniref:hypothetical protein n=1 Tax=Streptococcus pluranimalium TaxID=82348 RepID=UPI0039E914A0